MHSKGLAALASGEIKPFPGADDSLKRRLIFASCWVVTSRISQLFDDLLAIEAMDFNFIFAGADYPLHATLKQAKAPDGVVWPDEIVRDSLRQAPPAFFDTLILDGGNLILAASNVPDELVAMRASLDQELTRLGLEPLPLPILHITLARMVNVPESTEAKQKAFATYQEAMASWRESFADDPIGLSLEFNVRMASTYDLLTTPFRTED